jgi:hypothetical protein
MKIQAFDFSLNLLRAMLWQYNDAPRLESLVTQKQEWFNIENQGFWEDWQRDVFDLRTANAFGLSVWAIILDMPLTVDSGALPGEERLIFGFASDDENFSHGNFAPWVSLPLTVEQARLILRLRYFQLVTRGTVPEINEYFAALFGDQGSAYVVDGRNMTARYVFGFALSPDLQQVLSLFDLLPRPAGVFVDYVVIPDTTNWGFGRYHLNFNNGNFHA